MRYEATIVGLLVHAIDSVFLFADKKLRAYSEFTYKIDEAWRIPPHADGVGVFQDQDDNRHSIFLVVEAKRDMSARNHALEQIGRECSNFAAANQRRHFLGLIFIVSDSSITFSLYLLVSEGVVVSNSVASSEPPPMTFISTLLIEDTATRTDEKLAKLLFALATAGPHFTETHQVDMIPYAPSTSQGSVRPTSAPFDGAWIKTFPSTSARRVDVNLLMIPGAVLVVDTPALKVMRYPHIQGQVGPDEMTPALFIQAAQQLLDLHTSYQCAHGDIRLNNLIVNPAEEKVAWIDFDFASSDLKQRQYPSNWTFIIPDACRHDKAKHPNLITKEHDIFSFRSLLNLYCPLDETRSNDWRMLPQEVDLLEIITWLGRFDRDLVLKIQVATFDKKGTGSPTKGNA
ncbi:MAG: hypothetical protein OJI67_20675 [Prosthecobacter sp.]|nr:hypothetical protein [Prosthecobacter sp.]